MWLTIKETAERLGITTKTVRNWLKKGAWPTKQEDTHQGGTPRLLVFIEVEKTEVENAEVENAEVENAEVENAEVENAEVENAEV
ncbi:helix-turn-helix domain-containing protein, partial [bacterium]|nr:helix-turn-helix domain-containing protein [bacterium]